MDCTHPAYNKNRPSDYFLRALNHRKDEQIEKANEISSAEENIAEILEIADRQAKFIIDGATDLVSPKSSTRAFRLYKRIIDGIKNKTFSKKEEGAGYLVNECLDDYLAKRTIDLQTVAEERILHLLVCGSDSYPCYLTKRYLHMITECYLYGFDVQCVIMCRSALEASFMQAVPDSLCKQYFKPKIIPHKKNYFSLGHRLWIAKKEKICSKNTETVCDWADQVNTRANDLLHPDRDKSIALSQEVLIDTIMKTIQCIVAVDK